MACAVSYSRDEGLNQAELADRLDVERITLCRMIDRSATPDWSKGALIPMTGGSGACICCHQRIR